MKRSSLILIFFTCQFVLFGQTDSSVVMTPETFLQLVKTNHPMVRKANIKVEIAEKQFAAEKGNFDPVLSSSLSQKYFEQSEYYQLFGAQMKIPAWFGIEVYSGYDFNAGDYLNPERTLPQNGLMYAGVSIPVGRDLFIDYRMFEFKKADLYAQASSYEKQMLLNELLLDASVAYWNWYNAYNAMLIYESAFNTASARYMAVKNSALAGDRPFIDTVEAGIHMQNRYLGFINSKTDFENKENWFLLFYGPMDLFRLKCLIRFFRFILKPRR
ncbi:MAG: TolC family protein [Crocinitomicaceae bacterium]|nr:TolC family protein [Crocinitomicaceae bacterium]